MIDDRPELLTAAEVAEEFRVDRRTVTRWAKNGKLEYTRTPGGRIRFTRQAVDKALKGTNQ